MRPWMNFEKEEQLHNQRVIEHNLSLYIAKQTSSQLSIFVSDTAGNNLFSHPQMGYPTGDIFS